MKLLGHSLPHQGCGPSSSALPNKTSGMKTIWIKGSYSENYLNLYFSLQKTCLSVQKSIQGSLGHYAVTVTSASKLCSQSLCNNNGKCIWKTPKSPSCLHMPDSSSKKYVPNKSFRYILSPINKLKTIKDMKKGFVCHCYYGWHGESCQQCSSEFLRGKKTTPTVNCNSSVLLSMTLSVVLLKFFNSLLQC